LIASLHGHIHESPLMSGRIWQQVGNIPSFNVGQHSQTFRALLFDVEAVSSSAQLITVARSGEVTVMKRGESV